MSNAEVSPAPRALCVSIHDVAPATWRACEKLMAAVREVADIPMTLLVVPNYHHGSKPTDISDAEFTRALETERQRGCELALHGYTHWDDGPPPRNPYEYAKRNWYTAREGEFSALDVNEAARRIKLGLEWFGERGWKPEGFIAPAWLMSHGAWQALEKYDFYYACTLGHFHALPRRETYRSPAITYSSRSTWRRHFSYANAQTRITMCKIKNLRVVLHPADAQHPEVLRHFQHIIGRLLRNRIPLRKASVIRNGYFLAKSPTLHN